MALFSLYLLYLFVFSSVVHACSPVGVGYGQGLNGYYYDDMTFTTLAMERVDPTVDFDFGYTSPVWYMPQENYTILWLGGVQPLYSDTYTFYVDSDDGSRLYVNGELLFDHLVPQGETSWSGSIYLQAGQFYSIRVEYLQNLWNSMAHLSWSSSCQGQEIIPQSQLYTQDQYAAAQVPTCSAAPIGKGTGLQGQYFSDGSFTTKGINRVDATVNFDWGTGSPDPSLPVDYFSVVWTALVQPLYTGTYTFYVESDDGANLYVAGNQLVNHLVPQGATEYSGTINLVAGEVYILQLWYMEVTYTASAVLSWSSDCQAKQVIPQSQLYPGYGLTGNYYTDKSFTNLAYSQIDTNLNFNWGQGSPSGLPSDGFSIKWTGYIMPTCSGQYIFYTNSDDGSQVLVNGAVVTNAYYDKGASEVAGSSQSLNAFQTYTFEIDYYEDTGDASFNVYWSSTCQAEAEIAANQLFPSAISSSAVVPPPPTLAPTAAPIPPTPPPTPTPTSAPAHQIIHGLAYGGPDTVAQNLNTVFTWLGARMPISQMYSTMCGAWIINQVVDTWNAGNIPMISYQAQNLKSDQCNGNTQNTMLTINEGLEDANLQDFFQTMKGFLSGPNGVYGDGDDRRIYFRFAHEMNGNWYPWSGNPQAYVLAWQRVWNIAHQVGIDNTRMNWVWCPNANDVNSPPAEQYPHYLFSELVYFLNTNRYYPGDAYVDWIAMDGYNNADTWWPAPADTFGDMISRLRALAPSKPMGIAEVGCATTGPDGSVALKSQWITDFYTYCQQNNIKFVMWFHIEGGYPDYAAFDSRAGTESYSSPVSGTQLNVYNTYRTAVLNTGTIGTSLTSTNPRIISDDQFLGNF